jgi:tellurite resistance protein
MRWPRRVPPNLLGIPFGLAGLAEAWRAAAPVLGTPAAVAYGFFALAAAAWLILLTLYLAQGPRRLLADFRDPVLAPFVSLAAIIPMILATALVTAAFAAGRVLALIFLAVTYAYGGWLTGQWIAGEIPQEDSHPGYFLPTVAGGLIGAGAAAVFGLHTLAEASFGAAVVSWALMGSTVLNRLFFKRALPPALVPTLAIEMAPPAVAGAAYFAVAGPTIDAISAGLAGYAVLMAIVQLRFIPEYRRLSFGPGFWPFTFSYAAAATLALEWIGIERPPGSTAWTVLVLVLITGFIGIIAVRTVPLAVRGQLVPARPVPAAAVTSPQR